MSVAPNPYAAPAANVQTEWLASYRRGAVWVIYAMIGILALAAPGRHTRLVLLGSLGLQAAILFWCSLDGHVRRKAVPHGLILLFMATSPVSLAVYLVWTRGWRGLLSLTKAVGLAVAVAFGAMVLRLVLRL